MIFSDCSLRRSRLSASALIAGYSSLAIYYFGRWRKSFTKSLHAQGETGIHFRNCDRQQPGSVFSKFKTNTVKSTKATSAYRIFLGLLVEILQHQKKTSFNECKLRK
jgi:hypothetical protein